MSILYFRKASDEVISHCKCGDGRVGCIGQMDCPWCGCGWLFSCLTCRKAFTFAEGVELDTTWEELAREDFKSCRKREPDAEELDQWVAAFKSYAGDVGKIEVGKRYVYLDSIIFPADAHDVEFDGWHSHHHFETLPQFAALTDKNALEATLFKRDYWKATALPSTVI